MNRRQGFSSVEILIASALLVAAFIPIYSAIRGTHRTASLNEYHILARRRARRALAHVSAHPYDHIQERATGEAPPSGIPGLPTEGLEVRFRLRTGTEEETDLSTQVENLSFTMLSAYKDQLDLMETKVYFHEFPDEPGLARLAAHAKWTDPGAGGKERNYVALHFIEDPFHWRRR